MAAHPWFHILSAAVAAGMCIAVLGCSTIHKVPTEHIVMINGRGNPVDPTGNIGCQEEPNPCNGYHFLLRDYQELSRDRYDAYLQSLFMAMQKHAPGKDGRRRVLVFVHGGLNTQVGTVKRVAKLHQRILDAGYFPVFINWQSSLFSSYFDHLFNIRQGEPWEWKGWWMAPFYLATDLVRGIARAPVVWWFQAWNDISSWPIIKSNDQVDARRVAQDIENQNLLPMSQGEDGRRIPEMTLSTLSWILTFPTKFVTAPFIDALGKSAWDNLLRRTSMLYHTDGEFRTDSDVAKEAKNEGSFLDIKPHGALSIFMRRFQNHIQNHGGPQGWDITLVGHSMGTIVLNQLIRDFGELGNGTMPFNQIVYMAGASTIRDYQDAAFPYLRRNSHAKFYHVVLHDKAEARDRWELITYLDPPPRGSLLVWIDDFLSSPGTHLDRTVGRFINFVPALHNTPEDLRTRIHVKEFNAGWEFEATDPQKHGQFSQPFNFWMPDCWTPTSEGSGSCMASP